jgi:hypothetical protein
MRATSILGLSILTLLVSSPACTVVEPDDDNPFGTTPQPTTATPPDTGDATETASSGTGGDSSTGAPESTGALDSSSGMPPTTGVSAEESTTGGGGNGMQPQSGMWMPCSVPQDCDYSPALCITITDDMGTPLGGFCSDVGCLNAAADCAPSPNGIALPTCVNVTVNMMADTACALQCTGGIACPVPMQCTNVAGFGEICV